jgi:hypothetical protein
MYEGEVGRDYHNSLEFSHGMEYVLDPIGSSVIAALRSTGRQAIRLDGNLSGLPMYRVQVGPHNEIRSKSPRASAQSALLFNKRTPSFVVDRSRSSLITVFWEVKIWNRMAKIPDTSDNRSAAPRTVIIVSHQKFGRLNHFV